MKLLLKPIILLFILSNVNIVAQTDLLNSKKYWWYHYRLVNDFLVKGDCKGCSEPSNHRGLWNQPKAEWGDQTIDLGHYIAVLATEYKILHDSNQLTDTTVQEMYYALTAFNRLDYTAEDYYSMPRALDVFFVRDDVPSDFLNENVYPNHSRMIHGITSSRPMNSVESSNGDVMSHDQVYYT